MSTAARQTLLSRILTESEFWTRYEEQHDTITASDGISVTPYRTYKFGEFSETVYVYVYQFPDGFLAGSEYVGSCDMCQGRFDVQLRQQGTLTYTTWREAMEVFIEHQLEWFNQEQLNNYMNALAQKWNESAVLVTL
jgi:hypothetical protein